MQSKGSRRICQGFANTSSGHRREVESSRSRAHTIFTTWSFTKHPHVQPAGHWGVSALSGQQFGGALPRFVCGYCLWKEILNNVGTCPICHVNEMAHFRPSIGFRQKGSYGNQWQMFGTFPMLVHWWTLARSGFSVSYVISRRSSKW